MHYPAKLEFFLALFFFKKINSISLPVTDAKHGSTMSQAVGLFIEIKELLPSTQTTMWFKLK